MELDKINQLIKHGESNSLEFKTSTGQLKPTFETVCAFLNGHGGTVLIGVTDNGKIVGQSVSDSTKKDIAQEIKKLEPRAQLNIDYLAINNDKQVIVIHVEAGVHAPYVYDGRPFQREQSVTSKMSQHSYEQLIVNRGQLNHAWEDVPVSDYSLDFLDEDEIYKTIADGISENRIPASAQKDSIEEILQRFKLMDNDRVNRAAIVLFAKEAHLNFPQCMIKMARFQGVDKLGEFIDNQQISGHAFRILNEADFFLKRHLMISSSFKSDQFARIDKPALPMLAVREALINAIVHRDYSNRSTSISLAIYDDRLEIWNNGMLPPGLDIDDLKRKHDSVPRNKLIAKVFYTRGYIESWGTGTNKIMRLCREHGLPEPYYEEYTGGLSITFKFADHFNTNVTEINKSIILSERQEAILEVIRSINVATTIQIAGMLVPQTPIRTIQRELTYLQANQLITQKRIGKSIFWLIK